MADKAEINEAPRRRLAQLRASFKSQLVQMIVDVESLWHQLDTGESGPTTLEDLYGLVHRIVGSAGSFGYSRISREAAPLEALLSGIRVRGGGLDEEEHDQVGVFVQRLARLWKEVADSPENGPQASPSEKCVDRDRRLIYTVGQDLEVVDFVAQQLQQFGYRIECYPQQADILNALTAKLPAVIIVDLNLGADERAHAEWLQELAEQAPVVFLSSRGDIAARLAAVWARCSAYLLKPVEINDLVDWLERLTRRLPIEPYHVLIIDDDRYLAQSYALILRQAGIEATVLAQPLQILETLSERQPDLILMDVYMPECNGIDLVQVIRQHWAYLSIPIVFLSVEHDVRRQMAVKNLGGDDFLSKPIEPEQLVAAVLSRAERARALRSVMESDSLTGLLNHVSIKERLVVEMARAHRQGISLALALIDLDYFKSVNDRYGHLCGDRVLKSLTSLLNRRLRKTDVIGRYGGEEFAVIFPHTWVDRVVDVMNGIRESFSLVRHASVDQEFSVTFSCGVADYDGKGKGDVDAAALIAAADRALYAAKTGGRNRVARAE